MTIYHATSLVFTINGVPVVDFEPGTVKVNRGGLAVLPTELPVGTIECTLTDLKIDRWAVARSYAEAMRKWRRRK